MAVDATDGRARARASSSPRAKFGPPYLASWSSALLENGLTREYLDAVNIDLSSGRDRDKERGRKKKR